MKQIHLEECPRCHCKPILREWYIHGIANKKHYRFDCPKCGMKGMHHEHRNIERAVYGWNQRVEMEGKK